MVTPRTRNFSYAATTAAIYFVLAVAAVQSTRFDGGVACLWPGSAFLLAALRLAPAGERWPIALGSMIASIAASSLFGAGAAVAVPLAIVNLAEVLIALRLLELPTRFRGKPGSLQSLASFGVIAGLIAPGLTSVPGAAMVSWSSHTPVAANALNWFLAHGLGMISFTSVCQLALNGRLREWWREARPSVRRQALWCFATVAATAGFVFWAGKYPMLFLPVLPLMVTTFRLGDVGAAISVVIVALIGGAATVTGHGPIVMIDADSATRAAMLQFYLAATVLTTIPAAAELTRRRELYRRLRDSEARYRLLADHSSDVILNLDPDGTIRYISPSIARLGGYEPETLVGRDAIELVAPEDHDRVRAAHLEAVNGSGRTVRYEYGGLSRTGEIHWFETQSRAVLNAAGRVTGVVSAAREISHHKKVEAELAQAAATDALTGLANRRAFDRELSARIGEGDEGCVAIFDLDYFKRVNDVHGHEAGDKVLVLFARLAGRAVRDSDLVARLGGEEFGIVLPGIDIAQAEAVCERLRRTVEEAHVALANVYVRVTVSAGVATYGRDNSREDVIRAADEALYRAKAAGRNRLALAA